MAMVGMYAYADTYSYTFKKNDFSADETKNLNGIDWKLTSVFSKNAYYGFDSNLDRGFQIGSSSNPATNVELSTSGIIGTITSIKINTSGASKINATLDVTVGGKAFGEQYTLTSKNAEATFTGSASGEIKLSYANSGAAAIYIKSIEVTYELSADDVAAPTITGTTPFDGTTEVTITGADGTTIYYTTDGTEPTTSSTNAPTPVKFSIDKTTTVKAIAVKGNKQSTVATKEFIKFADMTIADLNELSANKDYVNLTITNGKVVYIDRRFNNPNVFVREGDKAIMFYNTTIEFKENATVSGTIKMDYENYRGIHEVTNNDFTDASALTITESDNAAVPTTATITDLLAMKHICDLVKIENVKITSEVDGEDVKYYATDGESTIQMYDAKKGQYEAIKDYANDGKEYNLIAVFNATYNNKAQLLPVSVETATGITDITVEKEFDENAPIYNLSGQRVDKNAKGILIQNGKKFIRR